MDEGNESLMETWCLGHGIILINLLYYRSLPIKASFWQKPIKLTPHEFPSGCEIKLNWLDSHFAIKHGRIKWQFYLTICSSLNDSTQNMFLCDFFLSQLCFGLFREILCFDYACKFKRAWKSHSLTRQNCRDEVVQGGASISNVCRLLTSSWELKI